MNKMCYCSCLSKTTQRLQLQSGKPVICSYSDMRYVSYHCYNNLLTTKIDATKK